MTYQIEITAGAHDDAETAYAWLAERSREQADRWYQGLFQQIDSLEKLPLRCPLASESDKLPEEVRVLLYGKGRQRYRILFTIRGDTVVVLYMRHVSRGEIEP